MTAVYCCAAVQCTAIHHYCNKLCTALTSSAHVSSEVPVHRGLLWACWERTRSHPSLRHMGRVPEGDGKPRARWRPHGTWGLCSGAAQNGTLAGAPLLSDVFLGNQWTGHLQGSSCPRQTANVTDVMHFALGTVVGCRIRDAGHRAREVQDTGRRGPAMRCGVRG